MTDISAPDPGNEARGAPPGTLGLGDVYAMRESSVVKPGLASKNAVRLGFWAAILTAIVAAVFMVVGIATPPRSGPFCGTACVPYPYTDVAAFIPQDYLWLYPGFLLAALFVVLMACIHGYVAEDRKIFSRIGLSFAILYAAVILVDYFIQLAVVVPSLQAGENAGLSLFTQYNPHGIFIVFEALGYLLLITALLFLAPVFAGGREERVIRWSFVLGFALALSAFVALPLVGYDIVAFEVTVLMIDWVVLILSGVLLALVFRGAARSAPIQKTKAAPGV